MKEIQTNQSTAENKASELTKNLKNHLLRVRIDTETLRKLNECASNIGVNKSQAVRLAISYLKENISKK